MRYAIFSDLHDNLTAFYQVLQDGLDHDAEQFIFLGDAGRDRQIFQELQTRQILCTFGNWEVSGWSRLAAPMDAWVREWPAAIQVGRMLFCHATPDLPAAVTTTATASSYMSNGVGWSTLFPRLHRNEEARWAALAAMENQNLRVAFHGHTHVQQVWAWTIADNGSRRLHSFTEPQEFVLEAGNDATPNRYLIGVGSAGAPDDGPQLRYVLYDDLTQKVSLRRL
ncbi:MAG: metallophosphoesterase family protein [Caldilineaceae bacterium]